jgi:ribosome-binding protein aMBF1 (putative translation factor)
MVLIDQIYTVEGYLYMYTEEQLSVLRRLHGMLTNQAIEVPEQFGDVIQALINKAGISVQTLANALECSELMIQLWVQDRKLPGKDVWPDLTDSVVELIDRELKE